MEYKIFPGVFNSGWDTGATKNTFEHAAVELEMKHWEKKKHPQCWTTWVCLLNYN